MGQEGFILSKEYVWEEYIVWLANDQGTAQVQGKY